MSRAGKELWFGRPETWFGGLGSAPDTLLDFGQLFTFVSKNLDEILCKSLQTHTPYPFKIGRLNHLLTCMYLFSKPDATEQVKCVKLLILQLYIRFHPGSRIF